MVLHCCLGARGRDCYRDADSCLARSSSNRCDMDGQDRNVRSDVRFPRLHLGVDLLASSIDL